MRFCRFSDQFQFPLKHQNRLLPGNSSQPGGEDDSLPVYIKTDLVTLTLTVTDLYGRYVSGLKKEAFTIWDEKEEQDITFFSDADAPVSIGILFDVSDSMSGDKIAKARNALEKFINTSHPSDEYFLIAFNSRAQLLLDRTRDGDAVLRQLTLVKPKNNTALYDALYLGAERVTRGSRQKKAILIISDGQDNSSRYNFSEVKKQIKETDVVVYAVGILDGRDSRQYDRNAGTGVFRSNHVCNWWKIILSANRC